MWLFILKMASSFPNNELVKLRSDFEMMRY